MSDKIREQRPRLSATRRIIERDTAREARQRAEKNTAFLDEAWAGSGWIPGIHFLRPRHGHPHPAVAGSDEGGGGDLEEGHQGLGLGLGQQQGHGQGQSQGAGGGGGVENPFMSFNDKSYMRSLTTLAQKHGIDLPTMWQPGGVLFAAMAEKDAQNPCWFPGAAKRAGDILKWRLAQNNDQHHYHQPEPQAQPQAPRPQAPPRQQATPLQQPRDQQKDHHHQHQQHHLAGNDRHDEHGGQNCRSASSQSPPTEQPRHAAPPRTISNDLLSSSPLGKVMSPDDSPDSKDTGFSPSTSIMAASILAGIKNSSARTVWPTSLAARTVRGRNIHKEEDGTRRGSADYTMHLTTPDDESSFGADNGGNDHGDDNEDDDDYDDDSGWNQVDTGSSERVLELPRAPAAGKQHASFPTAHSRKTKSKDKAAAAAAAFDLDLGDEDVNDTNHLRPAEILASSSAPPPPLLPPPRPPHSPVQGSKVWPTPSTRETGHYNDQTPPRESRAGPHSSTIFISPGSRPLPHHVATSSPSSPSRSPSPSLLPSSSSIFTTERLQQASAEIQQRKRLHGDVIEVGARLVLGLAEKQCGGPDGLPRQIHLMHPLWLQPEEATLPARFPRYVINTSVVYAPMHHSKPCEHWTLACIDTMARLIRIYDPLPNDERWAPLKPRLQEWGRSVITAARRRNDGDVDNPAKYNDDGEGDGGGEDEGEDEDGDGDVHVEMLVSIYPAIPFSTPSQSSRALIRSNPAYLPISVCPSHTRFNAPDECKADDHVSISLHFRTGRYSVTMSAVEYLSCLLCTVLCWA